MFTLNIISFIFLACFISVDTVKADDVLSPIMATSCQNITSTQSRLEVRTGAYEKALLIAVKDSDYLHAIASEYDDYGYNVLAYKILDNALKNISVVTTIDNDEKICLKLEGGIDKTLVDGVLFANNSKVAEKSNVSSIANEINLSLPKSIYDVDSLKPLVFIRDLEFYNNTSTSAFNDYISEIVSKEDNILITENVELADCIVELTVTESKIEKIDSNKSNYSVSILVELKKQDGSTIISKVASNELEISNSDNYQKVANKLILEILSNVFGILSDEFSVLQSDLVI